MSKIDQKYLRLRVESVNALPTIPGISRKLLKMLEDPNLSLETISNFVSYDPSLSTKILRMINSPIYGFPRRISSVNQAVVLLGINAVRGLFFGVSVFELMKEAMVGLWEHSLGCAIISRFIAKKKNLHDSEDISVSGLLHDIGKVIFMLQFNKEYSQVLEDSKNNNILIIEAEKKFFNATHSDAGTWIMNKWNFPGNLIEILEFHHKPSLAKKYSLETAIVHVADVLVRAKGFGFPGDNFIPPVDINAWNMLSLTEDNIREIFTELDDFTEGMDDIFV